jgi:hypothetical protein
MVDEMTSVRIRRQVTFQIDLRVHRCPIIEAECRDRMTIQVYKKYKNAETRIMKALIHCEGQELEVEVESGFQLRR